MKKTLYKLTTEGLGDWFIIAGTSTEAENKLSDLLKQEDHGFHNARHVSEIHVLATEGVYDHEKLVL